MKIKELDKATFCTEKCNGVVLGVINKNTYKKVVILSNRDKKLLDKLTELKAEICKGNRCQTCALRQTVLCSCVTGDLRKVPQSITVYEKEMEPPKPAYSAPEKVKTKEVNRVASCLRGLVSTCSHHGGNCDKCHYHDVCPMSFERDSNCVVYWTTESSRRYLMQAIRGSIKTICNREWCHECPFHQLPVNLMPKYPCMFKGKPKDWDDRIFSDKIIHEIERGLENETGK